MWEFLVTSMNTESYTALQISQRAVTADSKTKHLLLFGFARQFIDSLHAYMLTYMQTYSFFWNK